MSPTNTLASLDFGPGDKIRFAATLLPILGTIGGLIRISGGSQQATLVVLVPLLFIAFFGWRYAVAVRETRRAVFAVEQEMWTSRDARLRGRRQQQIEAQQEELRQLRLRQQAEQDHLMRKQPSPDQLKQMMERHRDEYEAFLRQESA